MMTQNCDIFSAFFSGRDESRKILSDFLGQIIQLAPPPQFNINYLIFPHEFETRQPIRNATVRERFAGRMPMLHHQPGQLMN